MTSKSTVAVKKPVSPSGETDSSLAISPTSKELVIGVVGYAGAFSEKFTADLQHQLKTKYGYEVFSPIKLSQLIISQFPAEIR